MTTSHQNNASDPVNLTLNYAYGVLEGECSAAINTVGLEPSVGFLHEPSGYQTKQSLVYDLQEPFRWIADVAVMEAFESGVLDLPDFYFTGDNYRYRFGQEAKRRFLDLLRERFNSGVKFRGHVFKWDTVIEQKTVELGRYLIGRTDRLNFSEPSPSLDLTGTRELRNRVLSLSQAKATKLGIGKTTLHYLRKRATGDGCLMLYGKIRAKIEQRSLPHHDRAVRSDLVEKQNSQDREIEVDDKDPCYRHALRG
jgi:CRISPR-associated protein Cas1